MKILESGTENICFHDWWAYIISAGLGKVYDDDSNSGI